MIILPAASEQTKILLVHSPYPGSLKFSGSPTSLLYAISPFAHSVETSSRFNIDAQSIGILDPVHPSVEFYQELQTLLEGGNIRVVCLSTSTAAIEETAKIVGLIREYATDVLVVAGGPHEDDCGRKMARVLPGIDLSIGGDSDFVLKYVLEMYFSREVDRQTFCVELKENLARATLQGGNVTVSSPWWPEPGSSEFQFGAIEPQMLPTRVTVSRTCNFSVFSAQKTIPLMISRGCPYGKCTFCAEDTSSGSKFVLHDFDWIADLVKMYPEAALYFQDSIFPHVGRVKERLLPMLRDLKVEWGCQVYLRTASRAFLKALADHGCRYIYTGVETSSEQILQSIGKVNVNKGLIRERLGWLSELGQRVGISLMFGGISVTGELLETSASIDATVRLARQIVADGVNVVGFYPNVQTVLPDTLVDIGFRRQGIKLDFYTMPRCELFECLEDGGVGYNFLTVNQVSSKEKKETVAARIVEAAYEVQSLGQKNW
jgi:radical SAM superfamily enzyme YgiQ (UPF0313 family)